VVVVVTRGHNLLRIAGRAQMEITAGRYG
jgi:hypothetical protein